MKKKNKKAESIKDVAFFKMPSKILGVEKELIQLFLLPISVIVIFLISLGLVILPKVDQIKSNFNEIEKFKKQTELNDQKKAYLLSIDQEQLTSDASYLNQAVLKEKKSYLLVGVIRKIADKYGYQIKSFSVNPGTIKEDEKKIKVSGEDLAMRMPVTVTLVGQGDNNLDLIKSLENTLPILFIDKFETKSSEGVSELNLLISSYYLPDKEDYTKGNLTLTDLQLTEDESDLLMRISSFETYNDLLKEGDSDSEDFVEYERESPFSL